MMKSLKAIFTFIVVVIVVSACGGGQAPVATESAPVGATTAPPTQVGPTSTPVPAVVRIGGSGGPDTLNPATALMSRSFIIFELVYSSLYELQLDGTYSLDLLESAENSPDGLVWTYKLRTGAKFHDGQPLTARDVLFSYQLYMGNPDSGESFPYMTPYTEGFSKVEAPDDQTVVLTLNEPIPNIESRIAFMYILPEHIWKDFNTFKAASEYTNDALVGSGPFKLKEYKQNEFTHLVANHEYFGKGPKVDEVIFQVFENADVMVQALKTGQVDMVTDVLNTAIPALKNAENVKVVSGPPFAPDVTDILINLVDPANCPEGSACTGHPSLRDRNVRLALSHATDKQDLINVILLGLGTPGVTLIPDSLGIWYNNTIQDYAFDLDKANQLLDAGGYKDTDGDGVRQMPDGSNPLIYRLNWSSDSTTSQRLAEMVSKTWEKIGVKTQMQALDPNALTTICCPNFDFDLIIWGWGSDPDPKALLNVMTTKEITTGVSETGYSSPEYDALYDQSNTEMDQQKRVDIIWKMQQIVHNDVVYIIPYYSQAVEAYRTDRFKGWIIDAPKLSLEDVSSLLVVEPAQ